MTFTGSIAVGKHLAAMAGQHMKPAIMELGGHAPVIVCEDADPVATAAASVAGKSRNAGQVCVSPTRWFVHERVYQQFLEAFAEKAAQVRLGNGLDPATEMGPLANERRLDAMTDFVRDAKSHGAKVLTGGTRDGNRGYYFPLTILAEVPDEARVMREEPFGPLALVNPVKTIEEAIEKITLLRPCRHSHAVSRQCDLLSEISEWQPIINHLWPGWKRRSRGGKRLRREAELRPVPLHSSKNVSHRTA